MNTKAREYAFTLNNYTPDEVDYLRRLAKDLPMESPSRGLAPAPQPYRAGWDQQDGTGLPPGLGSQAATPAGTPDTPQAAAASADEDGPRKKKAKLNGTNLKDVVMEVNLKYLVLGFEVGDETGTPHIQGYIYFKNARTWNNVRDILPARCAHIQRRHYKSSAERAAGYCLKDGQYEQYGCLPEQGKRSDLNEIQEMIKSGADESEIADAFFGDYVRYHAGIAKAIQLMQPIEENEFLPPRIPLQEDIKTLVIIGRAGTGKTEYAKAHFKTPLFVSHIDQLLKFNKKKHDGIIFDDMDFKHLPRTAQIHLVDWDNNRAIHCRFKVAEIPKHTKKIFCCNEYLFICDEAIERRIKMFNL